MIAQKGMPIVGLVTGLLALVLCPFFGIRSDLAVWIGIGVAALWQHRREEETPRSPEPSRIVYTGQ